MTPHFAKSFKKAYTKRIATKKNLEKKFEKRYDLFVESSTNPILKDHALTGKLTGKRAFSITGDIRVVYYVYEETAYFIDIGIHNQVYGE